MKTLRYVILRHDGIEQPHFDVMFEAAESGPLITLRSDAWPAVKGSTLQRLADHRRAYLDYEGPVSGNRGFVRRIASGTCELLPDDHGVLRVTLDGQTRFLVHAGSAVVN